MTLKISKVSGAAYIFDVVFQLNPPLSPYFCPVSLLLSEFAPGLIIIIRAFIFSLRILLLILSDHHYPSSSKYPLDIFCKLLFVGETSSKAFHFHKRLRVPLFYDDDNGG